MAVDIPVFWQALGQSGLLPPPEISQLAHAFGGVKGAATQGNSRTLAEWLIAEGKITRYQSTLLLAGTPGPFVYGEYCIRERINQGILVGRFRAVHLPTGHPVVLEFLSGPVASDPQLWQHVRQRALRECELNHPNLLRTFELVDLPTHKFLVMEDQPGQSAAELLATHGPAPAPEAARLARLAALGLAYLHQQGGVAADIRPEALWLEPEGNVRLVREPLAAAASLAALPEQLAAIRAEYAAPELAAHGKAPDALCDIYSLGCTLFQFLLGRPPFGGGSASGRAAIEEKLYRHATEPAMGLESASIPPPLTEVVMYMMAKNPLVRYQNAAEVADRLTAFVDPQLVHITSTAPAASLAAFETYLKNRPAPQPVPQPAAQTAANPFVPSPAAAPAASAASPFPGIQVGGNGSASPVASTPAASTPTPTGAAESPGQVPSGNVAVAEPLAAAAQPGPQVQATGSPAFVDTSSVSQRRATRKDKTKTGEAETDNSKRNTLLVVGAMVACVVLLVVAIMSRRGPESVATDDANKPADTSTTGGSRPGGGGPSRPSAPGGPVGPSRPGDPQTTGQEFIEDDGMTLWASPTEGKPIDFSYTPPGGQFFLVVRPADMLAHEEGRRVLEALEPQIGVSLEQWKEAAGVNLEDVEQIMLSLHPYNSQIHPSIRVTMRDANANVTTWPNSTPITRDGRRFSAGNGWYYFAPPTENGRVFVMGGEQEIRDVIDNQGRMRRELEQLGKSTDSDRHVTVLFAPNFLFSEGQALFAGTPREKLLDPLEWYLGRDLLAASFSMHLQNDYTYLEGQFIGQLDKTPLIRAGELRERLDESPAQFERYLATLNPHPYGRVMLNRLPQMLYYIHDNTRIDHGEDRSAVLVSIIPPFAAHNLALASELALSMSGGVPTGPVEAPTGPQSVEELLAVKTDLTFAQLSLEFAMRDLKQAVRDTTGSLPFEFDIRILGGDLQLNGITRNQQVRDFSASDQTLAEILTSLVMKANPVTTVQSPTEEDQKLLWVIGPDPDVPTRSVILITTRDSATAKGYMIPDVFLAE